ncbi:hypothetical protein Z946_459 [Sulfitobacter noctilucicola]|nr:hypothetical protein Z946_459 [Sulfitobacter noctilucicola]
MNCGIFAAVAIGNRVTDGRVAVKVRRWREGIEAIAAISNRLKRAFLCGNGRCCNGQRVAFNIGVVRQQVDLNAGIFVRHVGVIDRIRCVIHRVHCDGDCSCAFGAGWIGNDIGNCRFAIEVLVRRKDDLTIWVEGDFAVRAGG